MSLLPLWLAAGTLGAAGGLHCLAMCGGLQRVAIYGLPGSAIPIHPLPPTHGCTPRRQEVLFQLARVLAYAGLGALAGSGSALLRWGATAWPVMRPAWTLLNVAILLIGLAVLFTGRQPRWLDAMGQTVAQAMGARGPRPAAPGRTGSAWRPTLAGLAWGFLPCGLLYSAVALAALASDPLRGASVMGVFGLTTAAHLLWLPSVLTHVSRRVGPRWAPRTLEQLGMRLGGGLLAALALAALLALALGQPHPFCSR